MSKIHLPPELSSRQYTQLAYKIGHFPFEKLSDPAKELIVWSYSKLWTKKRLIESLNEDLTEIYLPEKGVFEVRWVYNNIPTLKQWELWRDNQQFLIQFRISPAIPGSGRVGILDLFPSNSDWSND